jgi:hypothetical protein
LVKDFWQEAEKLKNQRNNVLNAIIKQLEAKDPFGTKK